MRAPSHKGFVEEWRSVWGRKGRRTWNEHRVHPKVAWWAEEEYHHMPYFIKVIGSTSEHNHRSIKDITLEDVVDGCTWRVSFRAPEKYPMWTVGWPEFELHYNLQRGNMIVFAMVANSHFRFTLFNDQGSQIIQPTNSAASRQQALQAEMANYGEKSGGNRGSCHPAGTRREFQQDSHEEERYHDIAVEVGHNECIPYQAHLIGDTIIRLHKLQPSNRQRKSKLTNSAHDNHLICVHMGYSCGVHQLHNENSKTRAVKKQMLEFNERLVHMEIELPVMESALQEVVAETTGEVPLVPIEAQLDPLLFTFLHSKRRTVTTAERRAAKKAAGRYGRSLRRPNVVEVMKESHVYSDFSLKLPQTLVMGPNLMSRGHVVFPHGVLTLLDSTGRSWEMKWYETGRQRLTLLPRDWALFAMSHFLEEGDACVFEATNTESLTVLVRIFRVVEVPCNFTDDDIYTHYSLELES